MNKIETEDIKELFAEWGLWSLIDDVSPDGDGHGDNLQLTKEGLEAERMINLLLSDQSQKQPKGETIRNYNPEKRWDKYKKSKIEVREFDLVPKVQPEKQEGWVEDWSDKYNKHFKCNRCKSKCLIPVIEPLVVICPKCGELDLDEIS